MPPAALCCQRTGAQDAGARPLPVRCRSRGWMRGEPAGRPGLELSRSVFEVSRSMPRVLGSSFLVGSSRWRVVDVALVEVRQMPASGRKVSVVMQH